MPTRISRMNAPMPTTTNNVTTTKLQDTSSEDTTTMTTTVMTVTNDVGAMSVRRHRVDSPQQ